MFLKWHGFHILFCSRFIMICQFGLGKQDDGAARKMAQKKETGEKRVEDAQEKDIKNKEKGEKDWKIDDDNIVTKTVGLKMIQLGKY